MIFGRSREAAVATVSLLSSWQFPLSVVPDRPAKRCPPMADPSSYLGSWASSAALNDPFLSRVKLLMGFEGINGATGAPGMTDESPAAHGTATVHNQGQISTAQFKFGSSSYLGDGTGDGITFPDSADWDLSDANSDQFTIELWARPAGATNTNKPLVWQSASVGSTAFIFWCNTSGNGELQFSASADGTNAWSAIPTSSGITWAVQWYHLAVDKDATGKVRIYRDGVMVGSATPANSAMVNSSAVLGVGQDSLTTRSWNGHLDEVRITKGVARYASDGGFTPPVAPFPRT